MDAEIRKLTYVPRFAGTKRVMGHAAGVGSQVGELPPFLCKSEPTSHTGKTTDLRLEARITELEREREEKERHNREALAAVHQKAAEDLALALLEQKEILEREWSAPIQTAVTAFQEAQAQYFADAETAVVRLALAIAARVLHREAQMDPLLLRGPVRVALEDAQQGAMCVLEVAAEKAEAWEKWVASHEGSVARVQVRAKQDARPGHCRLEIGASAADLSVDAQLSDIERGFFDLLQRRPSVRNEVVE